MGGWGEAAHCGHGSQLDRLFSSLDARQMMDKRRGKVDLCFLLLILGFLLLQIDALLKLRNPYCMDTPGC